jgi:tetratricopeptide (TPR) repeat protein
LFPSFGEGAAADLRRAGLLRDDDKDPRLRALAPVREYAVRKYPPLSDDLSSALSLFLSLAVTYGPQVGARGGSEAVRRLATETANLEAMIITGLEKADPLPSVRAACALANLIRFTGLSTTAALERAREVSHSSGHPNAEAESLLSLGQIALSREKHEVTDSLLSAALPLFRSVSNLQGEANCLTVMGELASLRSEHAEARTRYEAALPLYRNVGDMTGVANCLWCLGGLAQLPPGDHERSKTLLEEALQLYRIVEGTLGEANCSWSLGDIALTRSGHGEEAQSLFEEALRLYRSVGSLRGEANCLRRLGDIAVRRSDHDVAMSRFEAALELYQKVRDPFSIGITHQRLARLDTDADERRRHVQAARESWMGVQRLDLIENLLREFGDLGEEPRVPNSG